MNAVFTLISSIVMAGVICIYPQEGAAQSGPNGFTAAELLTWDQTDQDSYIQVSVGMAGIIAARAESPAARCINDWYFRDRSERAERNSEIRALLRRFVDYHPQNVVAAVLERECGPIVPTE